MFDALAARAIGAELSGTIEHGRIQAVLFLDPLTVGLEVYAHQQRRYLLLSADPNRPRLHLVGEKLRRAPLTLTPFMLLLKKHADGAFINRIAVVPRERMILFELDHSIHGTSNLIVELMGRLSNLILLDPGGMILDAIRRVPRSVNRVRAIAPRERYIAPPSQNKADPLALTASQLSALLSQAAGTTLAERLVQTVAGTSPLLARELVYRVAGRTDAPFDHALVSSLLQEVQTVWRVPAEPSLALQDGEPIAVAAFRLSHLTDTVTLPSMSAAFERYFGAFESYEAVKAPLRQELAAALDRLRRKRASLERELTPPNEIEELRLKGEMILAYQSEISPTQSRLRAEFAPGKYVDIALDPKQTPVENAQKYFAEYRRAKEAQSQVPARIAAVEHEIAFAEQVLNDLETAETRAEIDQVIAEAREADLLKTETTRREHTPLRSEPRTYISPDGIPVLVGRNARQNDEITFQRAHPDDIWLHARERAGAHVVILNNGEPVPDSTIGFAAGLAAFYSQGRDENAVEVVLTPRRNVRRVGGGGARPGLVTVREERVLRVRPSAPD